MLISTRRIHATGDVGLSYSAVRNDRYSNQYRFVLELSRDMYRATPNLFLRRLPSERLIVETGLIG